MRKTQRWLGIDFSGNYRQWSAGRTNSNVWVATIENSDGLRLVDLRMVQKLEGNGSPFERLICLLGKGDFRAAAIDAPFSIPSQFIQNGRHHQDLLDKIDRIPHLGRPFPNGRRFISEVTGQEPPLSPPKPLRLTERYWQTRGIPVRSTLWYTPRGGAPMTAACLKLLAQAHHPLWPWVEKEEGILIEAFPAAQLRVWNCPNNRYNGNTPGAEERRKEIYNTISERINASGFESLVFASADALDAVICAFAAIAATNGRVFSEPQWPKASTEGWIAVHS